MGRFGIGELAVIFLIVLLLFGAAKLPHLARSLGESIREFKKSLEGPDKKSENQDTSR